jgi:hypothetical protein
MGVISGVTQPGERMEGGALQIGAVAKDRGEVAIAQVWQKS